MKNLFFCVIIKNILKVIEMYEKLVRDMIPDIITNIVTFVGVMVILLMKNWKQIRYA